MESEDMKPCLTSGGSATSRLETLPRASLAHLPTPLEKMERLSKILEGPTIWIKRDDCTGLAFGGSKVRALEFIVADAMRKGANTILTTGDLQSNHARLTAAAAKRFDLKAVLVLQGWKPRKYNGNLFLDQILGADIRFAGYNSIQASAESVKKELRDKGGVIYTLPEGGASPIGIIGYVNAAIELQAQARNKGLKIDYVVHSTASGGTQTGLTLGNAMLNSKTKVIGICAYTGIKKRLIQELVQKTEGACEILNLHLRVKPEDFCVIDHFYEDENQTTNVRKKVINAINIVAQTEGILLDPVYTGKAMAILIEMIKQNRFSKEDNVVFIHTGGTPTLFSSRARLSFLPSCFIRLYNKYARRHPILQKLAGARFFFWD